MRRTRGPRPTLPADERAAAVRARATAADVSAYLGALDADTTAFRSADLDVETKVVLFADWFGKGDRDLPHVEAVLEVAASDVDPALRAWALAEVIAGLPAGLAWQVPRLLQAAGALEPPFCALLRSRVVGTSRPARTACIGWLSSREALDLPGDLPALLVDPEAAVRRIGIDWLERIEPADLAPIAAALARLAARERRTDLRRALARVVREVGRSVPADPLPEDPDAAADRVGERIVVEWDAGGGRPRARRLLAQLAALGGAGLVTLLDLAHGARASTLRRECARRVAEGQKGPAHEDELDEAIARRRARPGAGKPDAQRAARRLEDAMIRRRGLRLRALLGLVGPEELLVTLPDGSVGLAADGRVTDLARRACALEPDTRVAIPHPVTLAPDARAATPAPREAIPQRQRLTAVVEAHQADDTVFALDVDVPRFARFAWAHGWAPDAKDVDEPGEWDAIAYASVLELGEPPVRAVWRHAATPVKPDPSLRVDPPEDAEETLEFWRGGDGPLPLGAVDPIVFSEVVVQLTARPERTPRAPARKRAPAPVPHDPVADLVELVERIRLLPELARAASDALRAVEGADRLVVAALSGLRDPAALARHLGKAPDEVARVVAGATAALADVLETEVAP